MTRIRKAIFPVAGLGTRFLPATKAMPKEMLPVVDRPLIQRFVHHVLDERPVHHGKHFLRHGLGRRQEAGSKTGDGKYGFSDAGHARFASVLRLVISCN